MADDQITNPFAPNYGVDWSRPRSVRPCCATSPIRSDIGDMYIGQFGTPNAPR